MWPRATKKFSVLASCVCWPLLAFARARVRCMREFGRRRDPAVARIRCAHARLAVHSSKWGLAQSERKEGEHRKGCSGIGSETGTYEPFQQQHKCGGDVGTADERATLREGGNGNEKSIVEEGGNGNERTRSREGGNGNEKSILEEGGDGNERTRSRGREGTGMRQRNQRSEGTGRYVHGRGAR